MSPCRRVVLSVIALLSLALLAACGSGRTPVVPPPGGGFANANLNGTYVFSIAGQDTSGSFIAIAGTFTANGQGGITAGVLSLNDPVEGTLSGQAITGGTYNVGVDGRPNGTSGLVVLQTAAANFSFDYVLTSSEHGLLTLFDPFNGTGSGTLDLQSSVTQSNVDGQSYSFNFTGVSAATTEVAFSTAGGFTLDANGDVGVTTSGWEDFNENGLAVCPVTTGCSITTGSLNLASIPGKAAFSTSAGTFTFDVYPIDPTHLKFVEVDASVITSGDAFTQSTSISSGNYVFSMAGVDASLAGPFTAAGIFNADGSGNITSNSVEDINDVGVPSEITGITGTYGPVSGGRSVVTLSGFVNGNGGTGCSACQFAVYPSSGGLQLIEIDDGGVTGGVAYSQSATTMASTGYGMNLSGNNGAEEDDIAEFNFSGTSLSGGHIDVNDIGATNFGLTFTSTYAPDSSIASRGVITPGSNGFNLVAYVVDTSTVVFVETDSNQVGLGSFVAQTATARSDTASRHLAVMRIVGGPNRKLKRHK